MAEQKVRSGVFGEAVEEYESARPGYPDGLVDDVLAFATDGLSSGAPGAPVSQVIEAGAGTGKATLAFAARGLALTSIEPDPRMAEALTRNCRPFPNATIEVCPFEDWPGIPESADLLFSAQAWHWIDPATRWHKAASLLKPGGAIAVWWNNFSLPDQPLRTELRAIHLRHAVPDLADTTLGRDDPDPGHALDAAPAPADVPGPAWPYTELEAHPDFHDVTHRAYERPIPFTAQRYIDLLQSLSSYRILDDGLRSSLLDDLASTVDSHAGLTLTVKTDLYLARTQPAAA